MTESTKVAYVFPGQGAQAVGMGKDLYDSFDSARSIFQKADDVLEFPLSRLCFEGPEEELQLTINTQPAMVTVSLACLAALRDQKGDDGLPEPTFVAGHSLGEYAALAAANVLDPANTIRLARERGRLMHEAALMNPGGMAAIIGLEEAPLSEICQQTDTLIANFNCPGQMVISGANENVAEAIELAKSRGAKRAVILAVSGAFHSPSMLPASDGLAKFVSTLDFQNPSVPIVGNTIAQPLYTAGVVKAELLIQLCNSVHWQRSIECMIDNGVTSFIEIGPGKVLTNLIKRINKEVKTQNIDSVEAINNLGNSST